LTNLAENEVLRDWDVELLDLFHEMAERLYNPRLPLSLHKLVFDLNALPQAALGSAGEGSTSPSIAPPEPAHAPALPAW
jgi:hypothetical protein